MATDIRMPDLRVELHYRWPKRVILRNSDIDRVAAALIRGTWWALKGTLQVHHIIAMADRDLRDLVSMDVGDLLANSTSPVRSHGGGFGPLSALDSGNG